MKKLLLGLGIVLFGLALVFGYLKFKDTFWSVDTQPNSVNQQRTNI